MKIQGRLPLQEDTLARRAARLLEPPHADVQDEISLDSGYAFPETLPDLQAAAERALGVYRSESLQYGPRFGLPAMRDWIAAHVAKDGISTGPNEILVVNGAKHGIELICRLFAEDGDTIAVTAPTYFTAIPIFRSFGLSFMQIRRDADGLDVEHLCDLLSWRKQNGLKPPKFIYDVPDFHNPTGVTMSLQRRERLLELAISAQIPIVEDSPYRGLRFEGERIPTLKQLDPGGLVFALGTFSKLLAPGLRIGWVNATPAMVARMAQLKSDGGTCPLTQRIILAFARERELERHLERVRSACKTHRDRMIAALARELPDAKFIVPHGGYYIWLEFPEQTDTDDLAARAFKEGVSVIAGSLFFANDAPRNYLRLSYSYATPEQIDEGIKRLASAYHSM